MKKWKETQKQNLKTKLNFQKLKQKLSNVKINWQQKMKKYKAKWYKRKNEKVKKESS